MQNFRNICYAIRCTKGISHLLCNSWYYVDQVQGLLLHALFTLRLWKSLCSCLQRFVSYWILIGSYEVHRLFEVLHFVTAVKDIFQVKCRTFWITVCDPHKKCIIDKQCEQLPIVSNQTCLLHQIGRAHVWTPVTDQSRMPSSAWKKKKKVITDKSWR